MIWLTAAKNVYTDSSLMGYYVYPSQLKNILKQWISLLSRQNHVRFRRFSIQ